MKNIIGLCAVLAVASCSSFSSAQKNEHAPRALFDGETLEGWRVIGGEAPFEVVDGVIIGKAVSNSPNTFLATEEKFSDFIFEADMKVDGPLNSGIMFRSGVRTLKNAPRMYGFQMEYDPTDRQWSGGIFGEAFGSWRNPIVDNAACQNAFKHGDWVTYRIEAIGSNINTFINGAPCARYLGEERTEGMFGLQIHGIGKSQPDGRQGSWKNINIWTENLDELKTALPDDVVEHNYFINTLSPWEKSQGFKLLWDGEDYGNWSLSKGGIVPADRWLSKDQAMFIALDKSSVKKPNVSLFTKEAFTDFEFQFDFKLEEGANSGIKYLKGLEYQIIDEAGYFRDVAPNHSRGALYDIYAPKNLSEIGRKPRLMKVGEWNRGKIIVRGRHIEHWLNKVKVVEFDRCSAAFDSAVQASKHKDKPNYGKVSSGRLMLQDHGGGVAYRNMKIKELGPSKSVADICN